MALSITDISFTEVTYKPTARCTECDWKAASASVAQCKSHVLDTGHEVHRDRLTKAAYYIRERKAANE